MGLSRDVLRLNKLRMDGRSRNVLRLNGLRIDALGRNVLRLNRPNMDGLTLIGLTMDGLRLNGLRDGWAEGLLSSSLILTWRPSEVVGHATSTLL